MLSGSPLQNRDLYMSVFVSSDEENDQSSWQSLQVKVFVESRVIWWIIYGSVTQHLCMGQPTSKVRYLAHGLTCRPT